MAKKRKKSLVGYVDYQWDRVFKHYSNGTLICPTLYNSKDKESGMIKKVRITVEEI